MNDNRFNHKACGFAIIVFEKAYVHDTDTMASSLFKQSYTTFYTGTGFRRDKCGQGGGYYVEALDLLDEFKIHEVDIDYPFKFIQSSDEIEDICLITKAIKDFWDEKVLIIEDTHNDDC